MLSHEAGVPSREGGCLAAPRPWPLAWLGQPTFWWTGPGQAAVGAGAMRAPATPSRVAVWGVVLVPLHACTPPWWGVLPGQWGTPVATNLVSSTRIGIAFALHSRNLIDRLNASFRMFVIVGIVSRMDN